MRLTIDLLRYVAGHINAIRQREICLRGYQIPAIENLGILQDGYDCLDLSDNSIVVMDNFPEMKRLIVLLLHNNKIKEIAKGLGAFLPKLENLMLTSNKIEKLSQLDGLSEFENLLRLNLSNNPVCKEDGYRLYVIARCPKLKHLDFQKIKQTERTEAEKIWADKLNLPKKASKKTKGQKVKAKVQNNGKEMNGDHSTMDVDENGNEENEEKAQQNGDNDVSMNGHAKKEEEVKLTKEQIQIIQKAINSASNDEEFDRLEKILRSGKMPQGDWKKLNNEQNT